MKEMLVQRKIINNNIPKKISMGTIKKQKKKFNSQKYYQVDNYQVKVNILLENVNALVIGM